MEERNVLPQRPSDDMTLSLMSVLQSRRRGVSFPVIAMLCALWGLTACGGGSSGVDPERAAAEFVRDPIALGERVFRSQCTQCHQRNGQGVTGAFPPLAGSARLLGPEPTPIAIVLLGLHGAIEVGDTFYNGVMPGHQRLMSDYEVAAALTYARQAWGNAAPPISPETVSKMRNFIGDRQTMLTADDLDKIPTAVPLSTP